MTIQRFVLCLVVCTAVAGMAWSQEFRASISGTVTDPTGAAVVGAKAVVTDVQKNTKSEVVTNGVGFYSVPFLLPSRYTLSVEASGFKKFVRQDIVLVSCPS